ncbi:MAG: hypothetical protein A3J04_00620 [Candidatus Ryanbacteria bacterium RIFCSPLOWO2_02_FULL_47_14]|uniref:Glycosyltransferase 2-like domain-containing protein n=1 Tax=Candidatus Ryanbacteria bacterium RIFCSPLOWO2_02_FULL_47_14 TaxID=1802129 RepID=A0A1G2H038_9BACT|nr:MAG: hypothetical protein A3J04_00620 [Candidatus Ryanbacteria bacterium RIFCSPLOWO2_02_FULL_47_14]
MTVSIGLPTYNRAHLLSRAIESVLAQSFTDFELIVVDDGSTDNTEELVKSFQDRRIRYLKHENNRGLMASRNTALRESHGKYLAFQDSDDWWHPDFLKESVRIFDEAPKMIGCVYSRIEKKYMNGELLVLPKVGDSITNGNLLSDFLSGGYLVTLQAVVMKKQCLDMVGYFDEDFQVFGDAEFIIRFAEHYEFAFNPNVRAFLEVQGDSISRNKKKRVEARELLYQKHKKSFERYPHAHARYVAHLGMSLTRQGARRRGLVYLRSAVKSRPWHLGYWLRYLKIALLLG